MGSHSDKDSAEMIEATTGKTNVIGDMIVENPLQRYSLAETGELGREFAITHGLEEHAELFSNAAMVARDPTQFSSVDSLLPEQRAALEFERDHKWHGTGQLYFSMLVCALGAAVQGWDQTGSNGANLSFPVEFGLVPAPEPAASAARRALYWLVKRAGAVNTSGTPTKGDWIVGVINAAPYMSAAFPGTWLSDPLNHFLGRRGEIFLTSLVLIATPIASGFSKNWQQLLIIRLIMGLGMGAKAATVPVYAAEMAPTRIRGALTMGWQLWVTFGIFLGFAANCVVMNTGSIAWRLQLGSAFIPAFPLAFLIFLSPESPRWLMKKGRYPQAFRSYNRLRRHEILSARDLFYSHTLYVEEKEIAQGSTYFTRLWDCFRIPRIRRANVAASTVMLSQQLCGINIISFYSSTVFKESGFTDRQALFASLGFGALNFVFAIPAVPAIDTFGRRSLLLSTFPGMAIFLFATGLCFLIDDGQMTLRLGLVATFIYIFTIFYSVGEGPVCFPYAAEVFPNIQREQGMAWAVTVNMFFAAILGLTFPAMKAAMSPLGAFCFYGGLNILATVMIFFLVPETKGLSLEELDDVFSVPTAKFGRYQLTQWLPYMIKRYVLRQNIATPRLHVGHKSVPMAPQPRRLDELEHVDKEQQL